MSTATTYNLSGTTFLSFADAVVRVRETLGEEGFGVLTEIDVQATLREKLGKEVAPYLILGACNPPYAHRALELHAELGGRFAVQRRRLRAGRRDARVRC